MSFEVAEVEQAIGKQFRTPALLIQAFTDRTAVPTERVTECNSRMAFLGDRIFHLVLSETLFHRTELTLAVIQEYGSRLGSNRSLNNYLRSRGWDRFIIIGDYQWFGEAASQRAFKREATVYEALVTAISLDDSMDAARTFLSNGYLSDIDALMNEQAGVNIVQLLNEYAVKRFGRIPTHSKSLIVHSDIGQECTCEYRLMGMIGHAIAPSKYEAKRKAAQSLYNQLLESDPRSPVQQNT